LADRPLLGFDLRCDVGVDSSVVHTSTGELDVDETIFESSAFQPEHGGDGGDKEYG